MHLLLRTLVLVSALLGNNVAHAADIHLAKSGRGEPLAGIMIEGELTQGDYLKFINAFLDNPGRNYGVILNSPGGNFLEALKIGRLVHALKLTTKAPDNTQIAMYEIHDPANKVCASSCFFIFAAGAKRFGEIVGVHRPYLPKSAYNQLNMDEAGQTHLKVRNLVEAYLKEIDVPLSYVERIMAVDSGDIDWLSEEELKKNFYGFAPAYREWIDAKCSPNTESDKQRMIKILAATPSQYKSMPVDKIPYMPLDKAFLNRYFAQEDHYYDCRDSTQRKEVDRLWHEMTLRKAQREQELRNAKSAH